MSSFDTASFDTASFDTAALQTELAQRITGEVRFGPGDRALYATDGSNYRQVPIGVVVPRSVEDVIETVAICRAHAAPVLSRGGGTSLAGQCCNVAVVIDWTKYLHDVLMLDAVSRRARVHPGCVLDRLRHEANAHQLTFGPDPSTHNHCTLGGMIGNNSCGVHSVMAGRTADNVESLEVLTYDGLRMTVGATSEEELASIIAGGGRRGEIYASLRHIRDTHADEIRARYPRIPRRVSGYNLDELLPENGFNVARALVGTEGTCVTVLEAEVDLIPDPPAKSVLILGYPDVYSAGDHIPEVMAAGPTGCEGVDRRLFELTKEQNLHPDAVELMPDGHGWLVVEFGGDTKRESDARAHDLMAQIGRGANAPSMKLFDDPTEEQKIWQVRESGLGATAHEPGGVNTWPGWEDSAVPPERVGDYLRDLRRLYDRYGYDASLYGHFGQGCIHTRIDFDLVTPEGIARFRSYMDDAADLVLSHGGSLSGEHGDGQSRAELLPKMFGDRLVQAFREFKSIWDPEGRMNPGKVVDPNPIDSNLRLGADYSPWEPVTFFSFPEDQNSFARAGGLRCVGVGNCRREEGGTMCPSYMVTREEKHSTRGRARLLFEMMRRDVIVDGWRSEAVRDALDLCLACKGCFGDCPVNVDMATYKAEFLAHHYQGRLRPPAHYSMGWLPVAARVAEHAPRAVNAVTHAPLLRRLVARVGGLDPRRDIPRFAESTLRDQLRDRPRQGGATPVVLWIDTFTNHFAPQIGLAAVDVLEHAGYSVDVLDKPLCCGLTWISTGQLKTARRVLRRTVDALAPYVRDGVPVIGLEPSCTAVFRHDLGQLFPNDQDACRLRDHTRTLAEHLQTGDWDPPRMPRRAVVHGHCHQKAVMKMGADEELLRRVGIDADVLDSGCCGLAGNFGFERGHHEMSIAAGERVLLPAVRDASADTLVMTDGFSCRTQIAENTDRRALHLAEVLAMAIHQAEPDVTPRWRPEEARFDSLVD
jgi:FAD/FMN-containing dehydrogenase/Fe-S oxidoreductase